MRLMLFLGALLLCKSVASNAISTNEVSTTTIANRFVDALQHQHYRDAAAMFAGGTGEITTTEHTLKRIYDSLGGFSTMHPTPALPNGKSLKLEVAAHRNAQLKFQKFVQVRYVSTASDGQPVFYELNLSADSMPPRILSFGLHFPVADTQSSKRANQLVTAINR